MWTQIGDRVQCIHDHAGGNKSLHIGDTGTVCRVSPSSYLPFAVEWDKVIDDGHDCGGYCTDGHGWWVGEENIGLLEDLISCEVSEEEFLSFIGGNKGEECAI